MITKHSNSQDQLNFLKTCTVFKICWKHAHILRCPRIAVASTASRVWRWATCHFWSRQFYWGNFEVTGFKRLDTKGLPFLDDWMTDFTRQKPGEPSTFLTFQRSSILGPHRTKCLQQDVGKMVLRCTSAITIIEHQPANYKLCFLSEKKLFSLIVDLNKTILAAFITCFARQPEKTKPNGETAMHCSPIIANCLRHRV